MKINTKEKLSALRGTQPWNDFILKLINTYMNNAESFEVTTPIKTVGEHEVTGLSGLEIKQNDLIKFNAWNTDGTVDVFYALVDETTSTIKDEQVITMVKYHLVNI